MTGYEIDNFYKLDERKYILEENKYFLTWYNKKINQGFSSILNLNQIQELINEIVLFFEFKYHDNLLMNNRCYRYYKNSEDFYKSLEIAKKMDINDLKYRLHHDYVQFLECSYFSYVILKKEKEKLCNLSFEIVHINRDGTIDKHYLESLKENNYLNDIEGINTADDLLNKYLSISSQVDYSKLEKLVFDHRTNLELRNKILELIPLAILYSKNSLPFYGYCRAKSFIRMFNKEYKLNLNTTEIDKIMSIDYSNKTSEINHNINIEQCNHPKKIKILGMRKKLNHKKDNC